MKNLQKVGQIEEKNSSKGPLGCLWLENVGEACSEVGGTESRVVDVGWRQQVADSQKEAASSQDTAHTALFSGLASWRPAGQQASGGKPSHTATLRVWSLS